MAKLKPQEIFTKEFLQEHYCNLRKSVRKIGLETGFDKKVVSRYLRKHNIQIRRQSFDNLKDKEFNRLTVKSLSPNRNCSGKIQWVCECECGQTKLVTSGDLKSGHTQSCGCVKSGPTRKNNPKSRAYRCLSGTYFGQLKQGAKDRGISFDITIEDAYLQLAKQGFCCALTNMPLIMTRDSQNFWGKITASLDRIDSTKGYSKDNIQWIHKILNRLKWTLNNEQFIGWCQLVIDNQQNKLQG